MSRYIRGFEPDPGVERRSQIVSRPTIDLSRSPDLGIVDNSGMRRDEGRRGGRRGG